MRFVHTSDWHLGRLFKGVSLLEEQAHALDRLREVVRDAKAELLVVAGDLYDRAVPPPEAVELLDGFLASMVSDGVPVVAIAGNHDSPERVAFGSRLFARARVHVAGKVERDVEALVFEDAHGPVHVLPFAYGEPAIVREKLGDATIEGHDAALAKRIDAALAKVPAGARTIGVVHAFVAGSIESSQSERPLAVGGAGSVAASRLAPFSYGALGHLHRPQQAGAPHVRYCGSLYRYSFAESDHDKGVCVVELDARGGASVETVSLPVKRGLRVVRGTLAELERAAQSDPRRDDYVLGELTDEGALYDAMARLRAAYPNALDLERTWLSDDGAAATMRGDHRARRPLDLFGEFYAEVEGGQLDEEKRAVMTDVLERIDRSDREERP